MPRVRRGRPFGSAVRADHLFADDNFKAAVARECAVITPEIELKWDYVERMQGVHNFHQVDRLAKFAQANGMIMHGHTLLWHKSIPQWAIRHLEQTPDWSIVDRYFASAMTRYGDLITSWDVVNEPLEMGDRMDGLRTTPFLEAFGPDYIRRALESARSFAPKAKLMINEFGLSYDLPDERNRRYFLLKMLEGLKNAGVPIDGVGLQSHLDLEKQPSFNPAMFASFLSDLAGMGLEIRISELDVKEHDYMAPVEVRDGRVADAVRAFLDVATACPAVNVISCWGLSDRYSWLHVEPEDVARGHWPSGQGPGLNRGLPLDADFNAKPFCRVLETALLRNRSGQQRA